ncbi:MAG TPA: Gldg family protein, partial [Kofleriaceae bacterium]|nr:Gldg family protein [Kofleriaceae bacterium]
MYWVWRRELHVMLRAPILYVVGGLFLVVQGVAFAGLVGTLSDLRRPAPLGALLEGQLAGTLLTWVLALVVLTLLGMRAIADDKRSGAWELLLTAQVGEGAAVVGKWLAAATLYAMLWVPTLAYLALVAVYRADRGGWDVAAIACGYAGAIAIGAALLAWAVAASAAMSSTLGAGGLGFALLVGLFLVGELPSLWPDLATDHPTIATALDAVSVRQRAIDFARGELSLAAIAYLAGLALTGLSLAIALACVGRRRDVRVRVAGTIVVALVATCACVLAVRHPMRIDVSAARRNTLAPGTLDVLATLPDAVTVTIIRPTLGGLEPIYDEVARVAQRMAERAPGMHVHWVDPAAAPGGLAAVARTAGLAESDIASSGAVVLARGDKRRVIDLPALATVDAGPGGAPTVEQLAVEQALAGALAQLVQSRIVTACATTGHGELPMTSRPDNIDWKLVADRLAADGIAVEDVVVSVEVPEHCTMVVVAGPATAFTPGEALVIQAYLAAGGALVVAAPT